jgi:hypothetical protein
MVLVMRRWRLNSGYCGTTDQRRTAAGTIPMLKHNIERDLGFFDNTGMVSTNLVVYLDARNTDSYPGSGTLWTDISGNGNNGTLTNGPTYSSTDGGYINLDGSNDYVSLGSKSIITSNTFTFETVINFNVLTAATYYTIFSYGGYISGGWLFQRPGDGGDPLRFGFNGTSLYNTATTFNTTGAWRHMVVSVSSGIPQAVFINNVSSALTGSGTVSITNPKTIEIGRRTDSATQYTNAKIGLVRLYNGTALSAAEVAQNYNAIRGRFGL